MISIIKLPPSKWHIYKDIRLKALYDDPQAFGSTYEVESTFSDEKWQERPLDNNTIILVAMDQEKVVGMVGAHWEHWEKVRHIAHIWGMFVDKEYRGQGIGRHLMEEIELKAKERPHTEKIKLEVVTDQETALELYKNLGYREVGVQERQMKQNNVYYNSYLMEKLV